MRKMHIILIIVSVLIILLIASFFILNYWNMENEDWLYTSGDEPLEEMIFDDVSENHWASEYISYLTQRKIMFCSGDGNFYPDEKVKYGEFIEILLRATMGRIDYENLSGEDFIKILENNKVFKENEIKFEKLNHEITKGEVAVLLAKVDLKIRNIRQELNMLNYQDIKSYDEVTQTLIGHSVYKGYFLNNTSGYFYPSQILNRAETAEIMYLYLNK